MTKSKKAVEYAMAIEYAKARVRRVSAKHNVPAPRGLTLHNLARKAVTPSLLALARINLARQTKDAANAVS